MSHALLFSLLRESSRSFYLTLRVLPGRIRPQIGLAYLLARTSDTIADTEVLPVEQRIEALRTYRECILESRVYSLELASLAQRQGSATDRVLLEKSGESLGLLQGMESNDRQLIQGVLTTIISGQELDLRRFAGAGERHVLALDTHEDLDDYTYRVAGCVGEFWTRMCRAHLFPEADLVEGDFLARGIRFGKGLQLINILRDLAADLRQGRCYLPVERLKSCGLLASDLLDASNEARLRPCYDQYLKLAGDHLAAGWAYTNLIPRKFIRVRLACAWPLLIGRDTLQLLKTAPVLD
ncbi:MAG: phytoene/squalene synthase family protein, partial [Limisphaerales bacterium]